MRHLPLHGLVVLEFSQYLAGPSAGLRLADLGARVIKIEKPGTGDPSRKMAIKNLWADDNSLLFHTINRNKESFTADLKNDEDAALVKKLIAKADVLTHNFRPGVMEKLGLDYTSAQKINPRIVYLEISGYGRRGPWKNKPGQDLLLQAITGFAYTSGNISDGPVPVGLSVIDSMCGVHAVQAILGVLIRRHKTGRGGFIELSLMETAISMQFELLTTFFNSKVGLQRSAVNNGSPLLGAPYGIYKTSDGYMALAMMDLNVLQEALGNNIRNGYNGNDAFASRDEIKKSIAKILLTQSSDYWVQKLLHYNLWATKVLNWEQMRDEGAYANLQMEQLLQLQNGEQVVATRCPIRINHKKFYKNTPAPQLGGHTELIKKELLQ